MAHLDILGMVSTTGKDEGFGPSMTGGSPRGGGPDWTKLSIIVGGGAMVVLLVVTTVNVAVVWQGVGDVDRVPLVSTLDIPLSTDAPETFAPVDVEPVVERTTVLLVGSDSRAGLSDAELAAIGTGDHGVDLTDTIILLQIDPATDRAHLLSLPRDLWVEHCNGRAGRINAAHATGEAVLGEGMGPSCLVTTIETMTGIGIDHYIRIDFAGFVQAVDAIGGVTFHVEQALQDAAAGLDVEKGCVTFDGVKAIQFVRARTLDSDLGRIARQQRFANELVDEIASVGTLANPARLQRLVGSISGSLQTDDGLGAAQMLTLASSLRGLSGERMLTATLPVTDARIDGAAVLLPIGELAERAYAPFRATGEASDPTPEPYASQPSEAGTTATPADGGVDPYAPPEDGAGFAAADRGVVDC
ncbi:hypothetical protein BH23ACT9_BH23ACT9_38730 [soil metagenome]